MASAAAGPWLDWLELYLLRSLAADAGVPEEQALPVLNRIRADVLADERAGVPREATSTTSSQPW